MVSKGGMDLTSLPALLEPKMIKTGNTVIGFSGSSPEMTEDYSSNSEQACCDKFLLCPLIKGPLAVQ